jgi:dodecin
LRVAALPLGCQVGSSPPWVKTEDAAKIGARPVGRDADHSRRCPWAKEQLIIDVVGVSEKSWEDAGRNGGETAAESLRDLRVAEVTKMDMKVENGKVTAFRTRVLLSFKYES